MPATTFDTWLAALAAAGKRGNDINIDRGLPFKWEFALRGDWTGATVASALRVQPDAGTPVETFTGANEGYDAETDLTLFSLTMPAVDTAALPADQTGEAVTRLAWDVLFTPSGGTQMRLFGAIANVTGEVTDA